MDNNLPLEKGQGTSFSSLKMVIWEGQKNGKRLFNITILQFYQLMLADIDRVLVLLHLWYLIHIIYFSSAMCLQIFCDVPMKLDNSQKYSCCRCFQELNKKRAFGAYMRTCPYKGKTYSNAIQAFMLKTLFNGRYNSGEGKDL